jgi:hypothetical protein
MINRPCRNPCTPKAASGSFYLNDLTSLARYMGDCWPKHWIRRHEGHEKWDGTGWYLERKAAEKIIKIGL